MADSAGTAAPSGTGQAVPWPAVIVLIFTLAAFALNGGFLYPANALRLNAAGYSPAVVGAVGSAGAFGYIIGSLLAPFIAALIGPRQAAAWSILASAVLIAAFALVPPVLAWYPMRVAHGITTTTLFVCGESALLAVAPAALRGRVIGSYTALNSLFFSAGPAVVGWLGFEGLLPYALVASVVGLLALPMASLGSVTPPLPTVPWRQLLRSVASIPALLAVITLWGWLDGAFINLLGVYAIERGAATARASLLLAFCAFGNVFLQLPIGWLADHLPRRTMLIALALAGCLLSLLLPFIDLSGQLVVAYLIVLGAVGFGTFTVSLIALGDVLTGSALVAANAAFGLCWGIGTFAGSAITGALMDTVGPSGFPLALAVGFLVQCVVVAVLPLSVGKAARNLP